MTRWAVSLAQIVNKRVQNIRWGRKHTSNANAKEDGVHCICECFPRIYANWQVNGRARNRHKWTRHSCRIPTLDSKYLRCVSRTTGQRLVSRSPNRSRWTLLKLDIYYKKIEPSIQIACRNEQTVTQGKTITKLSSESNGKSYQKRTRTGFAFTRLILYLSRTANDDSATVPFKSSKQNMKKVEQSISQ